VVFAVDSDPSRARTTIAAAGARADGLPLVEVVEGRAGVEWAAPRLIELCGRHDVAALVVDKRSASASLIAALEDAKLRVVAADSTSYTKACGQFFDAVTETGRLRHLDQPELMSALQAASVRPLGDAWAWDRKKPAADITPLTAATLALWGFANKVGRPKNAGTGRSIGFD
jgi:phage terminase large subunit-like protein